MTKRIRDVEKWANCDDFRSFESFGGFKRFPPDRMGGGGGARKSAHRSRNPGEFPGETDAASDIPGEFPRNTQGNSPGCWMRRRGLSWGVSARWPQVDGQSGLPSY